MRKFIKILLLFIVVCSINIINVKAFTPLDKILEYHIYVDPTPEGNLHMKYHIKWKVLNDEIDGPLEWVKVGVPNKYVSNIQILSQDVESAEYYSDSGAYIRLDLKQKYYVNEIVNIDFSFTQTHIYTLNGDFVEYLFKPGWFDEIKVSEIKVYWNSKNVDYCDTSKMIDDYYVWEVNDLDYGETIEVNVRYINTAFINLSEDNQYVDKYMTKEDYIIISVIVAIIVVTIIVLVICAYQQNDGYYSYRGFTGTRIRRRWWWHHHYGVDSKGKETKPPVIRSTGGGHSGGSSCACACACACAGGGRAGCSRKDFYNPNVEIDKLIQKLE